MKLLIRDYLASLREREELDAILPDLLSGLGFTVFSRPQRGTQQCGVDIAAVGEDDGERKVFLFSVKAGDLTRQDWDGTPQALRSSLNEIRDVYIKNRIPLRYKGLRVVICLAFGGVVQEQVREKLTGYIDDNSTDRISFDEWNGDSIAGLLLSGILREELLPKPLRASFQKAVAMVDEPDVSYQHFASLAAALCRAAAASNGARVRAASQLNICLWVLFVWARDRGNVEAAYRASELALLSIWDLLRPFIDAKNRTARELTRLTLQVINLHLTIASELLEKKIFPHVNTQHGLSAAIASRSTTDINLALFEILGRVGLAGLWIHWLAGKGDEVAQGAGQAVIKFTQAGLAMIRSNPTLFLPIADRQATDIALFLLLWVTSGLDGVGVTSWLEEMTRRLDFTIRTRGRYPSSAADYRDLAEHPRDGTNEYFEDSTSGSTLVPLLTAWLQALDRPEAVQALADLSREKLPHTNMQLWMPDDETEARTYVGHDHGRALCDLPVHEGGAELLRAITEACRIHGLGHITSISTGFWPVLLVACRHHQLPVPPHLWIEAMTPRPPQEGHGDAPAEQGCERGEAG